MTWESLRAIFMLGQGCVIIIISSQDFLTGYFDQSSAGLSQQMHLWSSCHDAKCKFFWRWHFVLSAQALSGGNTTQKFTSGQPPNQLSSSVSPTARREEIRGWRLRWQQPCTSECMMQPVDGECKVHCGRIGFCDSQISDKDNSQPANLQQFNSEFEVHCGRIEFGAEWASEEDKSQSGNIAADAFCT